MSKFRTEFLIDVLYELDTVGSQEENIELIRVDLEERLTPLDGEECPYPVSVSITPRAPTIDLVEVNSSNIEAIGYLASSQLLEIRFKGGARYHYLDVPSNIHKALMDSPSRGHFFHKVIKANYTCQKLMSHISRR